MDQQVQLPAPPKYQGVQGFNTQNFGQAWGQFVAPGAEQKASLPMPMSISSKPLHEHPNAYCAILETLGIAKVEIINNEVIAIGQKIDN